MNRYEIKRVVGNVIIIINRVSCIKEIQLSHNDFVWDTEFECGVIIE